MSREFCIGAGVNALTCGECPGFQPLPGKKGLLKDVSLVGICPMTGGEVRGDFPTQLAAAMRGTRIDFTPDNPEVFK